eukprot:5780689-Karenia_brevis.AAC.1
MAAPTTPHRSSERQRSRSRSVEKTIATREHLWMHTDGLLILANEAAFPGSSFDTSTTIHDSDSAMLVKRVRHMFGQAAGNRIYIANHRSLSQRLSGSEPDVAVLQRNLHTALHGPPGGIVLWTGE